MAAGEIGVAGQGHELAVDVQTVKGEALSDLLARHPRPVNPAAVTGPGQRKPAGAADHGPLGTIGLVDDGRLAGPGILRGEHKRFGAVVDAAVQVNPDRTGGAFLDRAHLPARPFQRGERTGGGARVVVAAARGNVELDPRTARSEQDRYKEEAEANGMRCEAHGVC